MKNLADIPQVLKDKARLTLPIFMIVDFLFWTKSVERISEIIFYGVKITKEECLGATNKI